MLEFLAKYHLEIRNIGLVLIAFIGSPFLIWRTYIASRQVKTNEANHKSEMFTKSIEQLGAMENETPSKERRIGAIYSLEKIAINNRDYYSQVMEVLCSYIRLHAITKSAFSKNEDLLVALTVVTRCKPNKNIFINEEMHEINLSGAFFNNSDLNDLNFDNANLSHCSFDRSYISNCSFFNTNLNGAFLDEVSIDDTDFSHANLAFSSIKNTDLEKAQLTWANLTGAQLTGTNLTEANLTRAKLTGANLTGANLTNTKMTNTTTKGTVFKDNIGYNKSTEVT
ncbi:pentapeptide repeat-containing protein [Pseudoalteromonas denitrificans]|uniref:Pentapeptide repeat-containing protein n=1 Tax=Pseudoalteromonas denitrificans DSM 6059 TaxID=1123010 RepID=A0A1I1U8P3_9GAMM|nr:pentapeptide repeat-containing protein [Pseudoalteromonas denitrificans]SFD67226.1 Pentapeptide repeat-containing protein [Pseudoalteromonas denitrificans DSM 6059]